MGHRGLNGASPFLQAWLLIYFLLLHLLDCLNLVVSSLPLHRKRTMAHLSQTQSLALDSACMALKGITLACWASLSTVFVLTWSKHTAESNLDSGLHRISECKKARSAEPTILRPGCILRSPEDNVWSPTDQWYQFLGWVLSSVIFMDVSCAVCVRYLVFFS